MWFIFLLVGLLSGLGESVGENSILKGHQDKKSSYIDHFGGLSLSQHMMDLVGGKIDMASLMNLVSSMSEKGNYKETLMKVIKPYLEESPYWPIVKQLINNNVDDKLVKTFIENSYNSLKEFQKSESGKRLATVVPKFLVATDLDSLMKVTLEEAEIVFDILENSDLKEDLLELITEYIVQAYGYFTDLPRDSTLRKFQMPMNLFFLTQGIPAFDVKSPVDSLTKIVNKCIQQFTTWKLDVTPYVNTVKDSLSQAIKIQAGDISLSTLKLHEKKSLIHRMLDTELVTPVQTVWTVYRHVSGGETRVTCGPHLLCLINRRESDNLTRQAVTKGVSLAVSWALSKGTNENYVELYKSVMAGSRGENCMSIYPVMGDMCTVFSWQKNQFMSTEYDHLEL